jgi:hypothetical protein
MKHCKNKSNLSVVADYLAGERPFTQLSMHISEQGKYRKNGEKWKDRNGIEWTKENGKTVKLTKSQSDVVREAIGRQVCKCGLEIRWGNKFDQLFFAKTGMCQDCLIDYEHNLHLTGVYPIYEKYKLISNELGFFEDAKQKMKETINFFKNEDSTVEVLCNSEGFMEKFHGTNKEKILADVTEDYKKVNVHVKELSNLKKEVKNEFKQLAKKFKLKIYV